MEYITRHDGYEYVAMVFGTTFLLPQLYYGWVNNSFKDVSVVSMGFIMTSGILWAIYMYENQLYIYAAMTTFVIMCAFAIVMSKIILYYRRVDEHFKTFDNKPVINVSTCV